MMVGPLSEIEIRIARLQKVIATVDRLGLAVPRSTLEELRTLHDILRGAKVCNLSGRQFKHLTRLAAEAMKEKK